MLSGMISAGGRKVNSEIVAENIKKADVKREALPFFLSSDGLIDLTIPRGRTII